LTLATSSFGAPDNPSDASIMMVPGKALALKIGTKHSISYFQPVDQSCSLTVVLAEAGEEVAMNDADRTRIVVPVAPGKALRIDGTQDKSAEFFCGPAGQKMTARVYTREHYKAAKS
jgi:hypothetical protein